MAERQSGGVRSADSCRVGTPRKATRIDAAMSGRRNSVEPHKEAAVFTYGVGVFVSVDAAVGRGGRR